MPSVTRQDDVCLLDLGDGENRMTPDWIRQIDDALDELDAEKDLAALVTVASGKFWSYGFDLDWMSEHPAEVDSFVSGAQRLFARVLVSDVPTVAAIQGHAFAAGAMLALAHDHRVMRTDRGFICAPEVDIKIPFTAGMTELFTAKLAQPTLHKLLVTGRRYIAADAEQAGIVDEVAAEADLRTTALSYARSQGGKDRATLGAIKSGIYANVVTALHEPLHVTLPGKPAAP